MMNVPLIFYAARETGDRDLDGWRVPIAEPPSGPWSAPTARPLTKASLTPRPASSCGKSTHQGLRADSTWARGLAWSLYGFGTVFTFTGGLGSGRRRAQRRLLHRPLPRRAWFPPGISTSRTAPTGSTTARPPPSPPRACGTSPALVWNRATRRPPQRYRDATLTILDSLCTDRYLAWSTPGWEGSEARRLSFPQKTGRRRVGDVGRFLLPRSRRQGPAGRPGNLDSRRVRRSGTKPEQSTVVAGLDRFSARRLSNCDVLHYGTQLGAARPSVLALDQAARTSTMRPDQSSEHDEPGEEAERARPASRRRICRSSSRKESTCSIPSPTVD